MFRPILDAIASNSVIGNLPATSTAKVERGRVERGRRNTALHYHLTSSELGDVETILWAFLENAGCSLLKKISFLLYFYLVFFSVISRQ